MHGFAEVLDILNKRAARGLAIEYVGARMQLPESSPREFIRISRVAIDEDEGGEWGFATFLIEHVDEHATSFPVVNTKT